MSRTTHEAYERSADVTNRRTATFLAAPLFALALLAGGCSKFDGIKLERVTEPPFPATVTTSTIEVVDGTSVAVFVRPFRGARALDPDDVRIVTDSDRVSVLPVTKSPTAADYNGTWIVTGLGPGKADLVVTLDLHDGEVHIPVNVTPQPAVAP